MAMKITTNANNKPIFKDVPAGDLFATPIYDELYVKTAKNDAISIRSGRPASFAPYDFVKIVKKIHIEFKE